MALLTAKPMPQKIVLLLQRRASLRVLLELIAVLHTANRNGMIVVKLIMHLSVLEFFLKHCLQPSVDGSLTNDHDVLDTGLAYDANGGIDELHLASSVDGC